MRRQSVRVLPDRLVVSCQDLMLVLGFCGLDLIEANGEGISVMVHCSVDLVLLLLGELLSEMVGILVILSVVVLEVHHLLEVLLDEADTGGTKSSFCSC